MVFYRKYRPQKIKELDSEELREKLYSIFSSGASSNDPRLSSKRTPSLRSSVPHAFLFTGPKGLGKTSAARIVAKILNCEKLVNKSLEPREIKKLSSNDLALTASIEPCNKCHQCVSITNGTNLDVLEIDAASNRGIDEIRDLREKIKLSPSSASKKVYIIDEVHMLTTEAFNALLKTLEEPPSHAVFILCTTEPQKIPATIFSRCFHISFRLATQKELVRSFKRIAKDENLPVDDEILDHLASLSEGSFRDGVKILEELAFVSGGKKITKELVEEKYQVASIKYQVSKMVEFLENKDVKGGLELVSELVKQGVDMKIFIEKMTDEIHSQILKNIGIKTTSLDSDLTSKLTIEELKSLIELLTKAYGEIKYAVLPQLPLELVIIEWSEQAQNHAEILNKPKASAEPRGNDIQRSLASSSASFGDTDQNEQKSKDNPDLWTKLIETVKSHNHSVAGVLRGCSFKSFDGKEFIIETGYKFHKERLEDKKTGALLEKIVGEITGNPVSVLILLKEK